MQNCPMTEFSRDAARCYLQTAVFVDDRIYEDGPGKAPSSGGLKSPAPRRPALASVAASTPTTAPPTGSATDDAKEVFSAQDIVASFAHEGIVCALYQPSHDSNLDEASDACKLCLGADIVLIDWDLYGDRGKRALSLVGALLKRSIEGAPDQLRLVVVYTGEPALETVLEQFFACLSKVLGEGEKPDREASGMALHTANNRVVVLGKPGLANTAMQNRVVKESDLAARTILEYSRLASGLLQGAVLRALGEIRRNTHRILTRFDAKLDPAYLTHRALLLPDDDASDHLLPLVMAEVQAVLEDRLPLPVFKKEVLNAWVEEKWTQPETLPDALPKEDPKAAIKQIVLSGRGVTETFRGLSKSKVKDPDWVGECLAGITKTGCHEDFAALASLRAHYGDAPRALHHGTLLSGPDDRHFVCLLPECDCVRLETKRRFLLMEMLAVETGCKKRDFLVVAGEGGKFRRFDLTNKVYHAQVEVFSPDSSSRVVEATRSSSSWVFHSADGQRSYTWLGQLKPDHAQRLAAAFAAELARVAVTESEWLRRMVR